MKKTSSSIINLPSFVHQIYKFDELKVFAKIRVIFIGKITQFLINKFEGKLFCRLINFLFKKNLIISKNILKILKILI